MQQMAALFSCTKCHKRYPFDELSQGEQLCKDCRNNFPVVKCTYCRAEFQQNSKGSTSSICAKCAQNVKHYGKPTACENCSVLAAFIGNRCQRCVNSEKKWGPPMVCEQCKLKCAFDRPERRKVNGKLLCWLCDQAYKRVLAKTRKTQDMVLKSSSSLPSSLVDSPSKLNSSSSNNGQSFAASQPQATSASFEGMTVLERLTKLATSGGSSRGNTPPLDNDRPVKAEVENRLTEKPQSSADDVKSAGEEEEEKQRPDKHHHRKHHHRHHHRSHSKRRHSKEEDDAGEVKKIKPEKNPANGVVTAAVSTPKSTGSNVSETGVDTTASENVILITQLREQIESLKKQMASKDQQLLEKDKKNTELKAQMYESDKKFRSKIQAMQQSHATAIETLQIKNRELTRQVSSLSKSKKTTETSALSLIAS